jgi:hypothetical protein
MRGSIISHLQSSSFYHLHDKMCVRSCIGFHSKTNEKQQFDGIYADFIYFVYELSDRQNLSDIHRYKFHPASFFFLGRVKRRKT